MAGLAWPENHATVGWECFEDYADNFISCPDYAAQGLRVLGIRRQEIQRVVSSESRASAFGCITEIIRGIKLGGAE